MLYGGIRKAAFGNNGKAKTGIVLEHKFVHDRRQFLIIG
jgi:hypothetical protein